MRDRRLIAVLAAGAVAAAAILVVVLFGIEPIPEFQELGASGASGFVAYVPDEDGRSQVNIVNLATTEVVEVRNGDGEAMGWDEDGNLKVAMWGTASRIRHVDPTTGDIVGSSQDPGFFEGPGGRDDLWVEHRNGRIVLDRGDGATASFAAPSSYDVTSASSMGENHVVFVDELGRVAVCEVGGDVVPILVADDAAPWTWATGRI